MTDNPDPAPQGPVYPPYGQPQGGQQFGAPPYVPPSASPQPGQTYNVLAIVSLISAFFISLVAIVTGHIALSQIKRTQEKGRGLALAGVIIGYTGVFFTLVFVVVFAAVTFFGAQRAIQSIPTGDPFPTLAPTDDDDLDWAAGTSLSASDRPEFLDSFGNDPDWKVATPDDGNGSWSYDSTDGACTLAFYQGLLPDDVKIVSGDDESSTASFLQYIDGASASDVDDLSIEDYLDYGTGGSASVDVLTLTGTDKNDDNWITAARAFAETGTGLYFDLTCLPSADIDDVYTTVLDGVVVDIR